MKINAKGEVRIEVEDMKQSCSYLLSCIHYIRKSQSQPLIGWSVEEEHGSETAEYLIIMAAQKIGLDLGADRAGRIDVSNYE